MAGLNATGPASKPGRAGSPGGGRPLREAHAHIAMHGRELTQLNLADCTSLQECLERVRQAADRLDRDDPGSHRWLLANGVRVEGWPERRWPTLSELDRAMGGSASDPSTRCASIMSFDHHAMIANTPAMRAAGITEATPSPPGGHIGRDLAGQLSGVLLEAASWMVRKVVPQPTPAERLDVLRVALADLARHGFVEVHDLLSPAWLGPALAELDRAGELTMDIWLYPAIEDLEPVHASRGQWERRRERGRPGSLALAGGKVFIDGTLNSRTAWMLEPYADGLAALPKGQPMMTLLNLREALTLTQRLGLGLATHAIGDAAVKAVLNMGSALTRHGPAQPVRDSSNVPWLRIEHCELIDPSDVPRFAELNVVCSVQPCHLLYDIEALERGCPDRLGRVLPLRSLIRAGCKPGELLWFGSDTPIVRPDPLDSIIAATERRRIKGAPGGPPSRAIAPEQAITEDEAWRAFESPGQS